MIMPTFMLLNSIAGLGLPTALNVLIASDKYSTKNLVFTSILISLSIDILIILFLIVSCNFLSTNLLNDSRLTLGLLSIGFVLPFITISNCLRSYFFAKQRMYPHVITNIIEDLVKLIFIIIGIPFFLSKGIEYAIAFIILSNIFCELSSIIIFIFLIPNFKCDKKELRPNNTNNFIINEYGIINGYVMQLVLLPSFFTGAISQALIPIVSKSYTKGNFKYISKKIKQAIFFCLLIGIPATIIFELFPDVLLKFLFNTNKGINYIKVMAPICLLHYIQSPISSSLQAMGSAKISMTGTLIGMILRTLTLFIISYRSLEFINSY